MTLKSKIGVESSMVHNRNTFNKDKIRPAAKENRHHKHAGQGMARR